MAFITAAIIGGGVSLLGGGLGLLGASNQADAAKEAAKTQAGASDYAANLQWNALQQQQQLNEPWRAAGEYGLAQMQNPDFYKAPTNDQIMSNMDPSYQFRLDQGRKALEASAAARGDQFSGNTLKALTDYGQNFASTEYNNAYNRFTNNQNTVFNRLASLSGLGQTATGQSGAASQNYANNAGAAYTGTANAQGAGMMGAANAWAGGLSGLGNAVSSGANNWMQMNMVNSLMNKKATGLADLGSMPSSDSFEMPAFGSSLGGSGAYKL